MKLVGMIKLKRPIFKYHPIMYRPLMRNGIQSRSLHYKPTAVIVGQTGAGKTTLANKLCNTSHNAGAGRGSQTQQIFRNNVCFGMNAFGLIDTPGTDSSTDTYKHAFQLREALTATAINTIFVVIKFENRFEKMVDIFYKQPVHLFANKIVVLISHLDLSNDGDADYKEISTMFVEQCPDVSNVIFYSNKSSSIDVANCMFSCILNMKPEKIQISDEDFHLNFNTVEATLQMRQSFNQYTKKARDVSTRLTNYICDEMDSTLDEADDKDEILHLVLVQLKNDLEAMCDDFVKEHGGKMTEMNYYTFSIKMQSENVKLCDDFTNLVVPLMSYNLFDNQDPRNLIKQCPHCNLIWYKTEGCDGQTTCGNRGFENTNSASSLKQLFKYAVTYVFGKVKIIKNPIETKPRTPVRANSSTSSSVGCNATIVWSNLPKLEDKIIFSLYSVKTMDEARSIIRSERFKDARKRYESGIDTTFYD